MKRFYQKILLIVAALAFSYPTLTRAENNLSDHEKVIAFSQSAFQAQFSLSEKFRTIEEIDKILSPYFTTSAKKLFLEENLISENGQFITCGTDFPIYYIPFFTYSDETKSVWQQNKIYLFEYFPKTDEGPVSYESHYEGVLLSNEEGTWKIAEFLYDNIPSEIVNQNEKEQDSSALAINNENMYREKIVQSSLTIGLCMSPLQTLIKYGFCTSGKIKYQ
ncbi:DUF3993 domain-containing protein [Bacillus sp. S/N-304-OC-R1]|uniref:DUF3993 domain-containing protein n=1 Tax=Bacillus sp. S/N-304-OC-R1 TaxID=2758034 RepID=UPI001C8D48C3|nr:DUF3993 domain-containing protein [Bacillus sp. S/N-304-OC-R1]MBY0120884.1 DUF3993 domain-containing protein [Bacillus sp. S/N-304-OC-R1]